MRAVSIIVIMLFLMAPALPPAAANHFLVHDLTEDPFPAATLEDDGAVLVKPGNTLHGIANRVTAPGRSIGDGGLFLDTRLANTAGAKALGVSVGAQSMVFAGSAGSTAVDHPAMLLPGIHQPFAWYGEWYDLNTDGVIDDIHDDACGGTPCAGDEFAWRGFASEESVTLGFFILPRQRSTTLGVPPWPGLSSASDLSDRNQMGDNGFFLEDRTARTNTEQGWFGPYMRNIDAGFLATQQTVTIADALRVSKDPTFDVADPDALYDVDRYTGVSPDVEALYLSTTATYQGLGDFKPAVPPEVAGMALDLVDQALIVEQSIASEGVGVMEDAVLATLAKEPNTSEDSYEGRALFGGQGDFVGSFNDYSGFQDLPHLLFDAVPLTPVCAATYVAVPGTSVVEEATLFCPRPSYRATATGVSTAMGTTFALHGDPLAASRNEARTAGTLLSFDAFVLLWQDRNGDAHVGTVCDPATAAFDAARNACRDPPRPWPGELSSEAQSICPSTNVPGTSIRVGPVGGDWGGAVLIQDHGQLTRQGYGSTVQSLEGAGEVLLRWESGCTAGGSSTSLRSRDAILLPPTFGATLRIETAATLPRYELSHLGIEIGPETVVDVDYLQAQL